MIVPRRVRPLWWHKLAGRANSDHEYESTQASTEFVIMIVTERT